MPLILRIMAALLLSMPVFSQKEQKEKPLPSFGKVDKSDLELKDCDFDRDASAMVLFDVAEFRYDVMGRELVSEFNRHIRIKILKDNGKTKADIKIFFKSYRNKQSVQNLSANTYNLDQAGNITIAKLEKKLVYEKRISNYYSEQAFTMPDVKAGSIIEYKYSLKGAPLDDWYFQDDIPVRYSRYTMLFPPEFEIHARPSCIYPVDYKDKTNGTQGQMVFVQRNLPALRTEEFTSCQTDYLERLELWPVAINYPGNRISLIKTWKEVISDLMQDEDFGAQLSKEIPRTSDLDLQLKTLTDPYKKMVAIHNYVKRNMKWDGVNSIWALDGVKSAWKDRRGTSGEINLILINLLRDADITVYPVLASTHEHGRISITFPDISKFNKVMAYVIIGDHTYVLDGTDQLTPSNMIPPDVMASEALIINKSKETRNGFIQLWDGVHKQRNTALFQATINEEGEMSGNAYISSHDYARISRLPVIRESKTKYIQEYYTSRNPDLIIDSLEIKNEDIDTLPLQQNMTFHMPVKGSGDYQYFSTNIFSSLQVNPFIADKRYTDVFFGTNQTYLIVASVFIPEGYAFEELPPNMRMTTEDKSVSVTRMSGVTGNSLSARITLEFTKPVYGADEYPALKEFYKKLYSLLNEQFVIKKKSTL